MSCRSDVLHHLLELDLPYRWPHGIKPDASEREMAAFMLRSSFLKKFQDDVPKSAARNAIDLFLQCNARCADWSYAPGTWLDEVLLGQFKAQVAHFFNVEFLDGLSASSLVSEGRVGPGANVGAHGSDFYTKLFSGPLTCTDKVLHTAYVQSLRSCHPSWLSAELMRSSVYGPPEVVEGSRLTTVAKTAKIARTICVEPTLNMFFQLGLGSLVERRLKSRFSIDLSLQPGFNRDLCKIGSESGRYGTIDLSSASDTVSMKLLEWALPSELYALIQLLRSPSCDVQGESVNLNMVCTMGNGFCFPLQTALFSCVVAAVYDLLGIRLGRAKRFGSRWYLGNFGVFGDDIIVERSAFNLTCRLLGLLGFKVNTEKSFNDGDFRESCGSDFFRGCNVRGVYVTTLKTPQDRTTVMNRLIEWMTTHSIDLPRTMAYLISRTPILRVPPWEGYDSGIRVPLQRRIPGVRSCTHYWVYKAWKVRTPCLRIHEDAAVTVPRNERFKRIYNPAGLFIALLHGSLRKDKISIRNSANVYSLKVLRTPNWWFEARGLENRDPEWPRRWESVVTNYF